MATMSELARATPKNQLWITRGHLAALAVATAAIAVLAFLVGVEVGRSGQPEQADQLEPAAAAFLPDASDEEALDALLREVEQAQERLQPAEASAAAGDVTFNQALPDDHPSDVPDEPPPTSVVTELGAEHDDGPAPPADAGTGAPDSGWAVQIASYEDVAEADAHVARLLEQDVAAYRVAGLVSGQTWHRVRVGGFATQQEASEARQELATALGLGDLMVAHAP